MNCIRDSFWRSNLIFVFIFCKYNYFGFWVGPIAKFKVCNPDLWPRITILIWNMTDHTKSYWKNVRWNTAANRLLILFLFEGMETASPDKNVELSVYFCPSLCDLIQKFIVARLVRASRTWYQQTDTEGSRYWSGSMFQLEWHWL